MLIMTLAFASQLRSLGIEPEVWIGEGSGVWTALCAADGLELTEAASIVYGLYDNQMINQKLAALPQKTLQQPVYIAQTGEELAAFDPSSAMRFLDIEQPVKSPLFKQESTALMIDLSKKQGIVVEKGAEKQPNHLMET